MIIIKFSVMEYYRSSLLGISDGDLL